MIDLNQLRALIIKPSLLDLGLYSQAAENLLIGTGLVESGFEYLRQLPDGPALGFWQMEPSTHQDLWKNWLCYRDKFLWIILQELPSTPGDSDDTAYIRKQITQQGWVPDAWRLVTDLRYAVMFARFHYYRVPEELPRADDIEGLARYWKKYYNTPKGKGTMERFVNLYKTKIL